MSGAGAAPVLYDKRGAIAEVVLNRPRELNAYDTAMRDGLYSTLTAIRDDPEIAVVLLMGNGRSFSSGGDLREFGSALSPTSARAVRWQRDVWGTLWSLSPLTIAAVHGPVRGGGFEMMLLCDQVVAARQATFALPETGLAMIPGVGGTQTLPRLAGVGAALDLTLSGRVIDVTAARAWGLVQHVAADSEIRAKARSVARRLAKLPRDLVAKTKRLVNQADDFTLAAGLQRERRFAREES